MINEKLGEQSLDLEVKVEPLLFAKKPKSKIKQTIEKALKPLLDKQPNLKLTGILTIDDINDIKDILESLPSLYWPKDIVVAWDVDQTVLTQDSKALRGINYGTQALIKEILNAFYPDDDLMRVAYEQCSNVLIQPEIKDLIESTREKGITTIGLTGRTPKPITQREVPDLFVTDKDLNTVEVSFDGMLAKKHHNLDLTDKFSQEEQAKGQKLFHNGVMMTGGTNKDQAVEHLFNAMKINPKVMVFIDDSATQLMKVRDYCNKHDILFMGFHYNRFYKTDHTPDMNVVNRQIEYMKIWKIWLNDEEATPSDEYKEEQKAKLK